MNDTAPQATGTAGRLLGGQTAPEGKGPLNRPPRASPNQIDVVGLRDDGWIDLGECKWGPVRSPAALERELDQKARAYPNLRGATIGRRIFTRQAPPEKGRGERGGVVCDSF